MIRKSLLTILAAVLMTGSLAAQQMTTVVVAGEFKGTMKDIDNAFNSGKVDFVVSPVSVNQVDFLNQKAVPYSKEVTIVAKLDQIVKTSATVSVALPDGKQDIKWLFRWFIASEIKYVKVEGNLIKMEDFFKPYL